MKPVFVAGLLFLLAPLVFSFAESISISHVLKKRGYRGYDGSGSYSSEEEPSYKHRRGYSRKCHHYPSHEGGYPFEGFPYGGYPMQFPQPHIPPPMVFPPLQLPPASPIQADFVSPKIAPPTLEGYPILEGPLALQGSPALEGPLALQGSPALAGPLALQGSPALEGPLALQGSPAIQSAVAPEPVVADSAIAPSPVASLQVPSPWVGGRKKRAFHVAATKEKADEKEVESGARQAKESDGQIVKREKRKVNNKYVPKKEYGAETTHTPYAQLSHEYSPKTDRKEGKNKKLKSPVTGEKEEKGAAKAGGADHAYAQSQSYKKKQKQEEKKAKPPNKKKEEAPEEEEEESLVGTNEQNSEFTQGGPQFRSTWDVRRRRRSPTTA